MKQASSSEYANAEGWAFGGCDIQSLQTELAVARQQKQVLLQQTVLPGLQLADHDAAALQLIATKAQPPLKAAASSAAATSVSPSKQAPLRSLSWGGKPKQSARPPLRRNTAEAKTLHTALPPQLLRQQEPLSPPDSADHDALQQTQHSQQRQIQQDEQHLLQIQAEQLPQQLVVPLQPLQQAIPQPKVEQWLLQHQEGPESAMSQAQHAALRQKVLQEVMQAITLQGSNISTPVNVQGIVDAVKQQIADARAAAQRETDAAETKKLQSVQRRASKDVLQQADQVVAKANAAAAEAAQRSEAEASHLRRELNALKKEKRDLVQHCSASDKELASLLMVQERLQQQLTGAKAACKVSDSRQTDMLTQHEAQIADLQAQIEASHQQISELEAAHQQSISDHMATVDTCDQQEADAQRQHAMHAAYVHEQVTAGERLRLEVATAAEEAEQHMAAVAAYTGALQQAYCHSQTELIQELQQLATDVADFQTACSSNIAGVPGQGSVNEVLTRLVDMQSAVEGRSGLQGLLDEHIRIKSQLMEATQQVCSLQQQLSEQASLGTAHSIDMSRLQSKVEGLQTDIGSLTSSLQNKGQECAALQQECRDLQDQLQSAEADYAKELCSNTVKKQQLEQEVQQRDTQIQQMQQQLQAAAQHAQRTQQQHDLQILRTYRAAAAKSAEHLQELKDRYFHTVPVGPAANQGRKQGLASVLKMQRHDIAAAYAEFQQVRGSIQSMPSMPVTPSSSAQRSMWAEGSFTSLKQPWRQGSVQGPPISEGTSSGLKQPWKQGSVQSPVIPEAVLASDPAHSFALRSINRATSTSPQRRGSPEQSFSPRQTLSHLASSHHRQDVTEHADRVPGSPRPGSMRQGHLSWLTLPQTDISTSSADLAASGSDSTAAVPSDGHSGGAAADVQPQPNWQLPFLQQLVQFEACLLTALMGLLTQKPQNAADEQKKQEAERLQSWPKGTPKEVAADTTGEMVRAMSAQKRDLNRRLKAAENSNRQLRSELQHYRGLPHMSHSADPQQGSVGGIRESWQEMAAVLDMLQDMSEAPEDAPSNQGGLPRTASSCMPVSFLPSQPVRCASAISPTQSKAEWSQSYASVPTTPAASSWIGDTQSSARQKQHPLSARCKSASQASRMSSAGTGRHRNSPMSACSSRKQPASMREWQS